MDLLIGKKRVPLGVVGVIYESRPNVTADVAGLCIKTGNVCVLRGGKEAFQSNNAIVKIFHEAISRLRTGSQYGTAGAEYHPGKCSGHDEAE